MPPLSLGEDDKILDVTDSEDSSDKVYPSQPLSAEHASDIEYPYVSMGSQANSDWKSHQDDKSSILTADEIADIVGFLIMCFEAFLGDMSRGMMFPTLWPLVESLGGTQVTQGYAVAAFSFGRVLSSPVFGSWSLTRGYCTTLATSTAILLFGTLLYAQAGNVGMPEFLIFSQVVLGVGSGTLGVTRAFVADITPHRNRTTYMSWFTAVQFSGFTVTPIIGAILVRIFENDNNVIQKGIFVLDTYTAPAYFMSICCIIALILLFTLFDEAIRDNHQKTKPKKKPKHDKEELAHTAVCCSLLTVYDLAILGCMMLNMVTKGTFGVFEALGVDIAESCFGMENSESGFTVGICGIFGVIILLSMGRIGKFMTDVQMIIFGVIVMCIGILSLMGLDENIESTLRYNLSFFMVYSVGFPVSHTATIGLFSKIVGRRPQGTLQGIFASSGSLARMLFPILTGYISHYQGLNAVCVTLTLIMAVAVLLTSLLKNTFQKLSS